MDWKEKYLGKITLGDAFDVMADLPDKSIDLIITDPPYGLSYQSPRPIEGNEKSLIENDGFDEFMKLLERFRIELDRIMADNSEAYVFSGGGGALKPILAYSWLEYNKATRYRVKNLIVWDKEYVGMGWDWRFQYETIFQLSAGDGLTNANSETGHYTGAGCLGSARSNIIRCKKEIPGVDDHPTMKPVPLIEKILMAKRSELVFDPFMGSGTTAVAAERQKRPWFGVELNPTYHKLGCDRVWREQSQLKLF
jgi:site-specific DNA-methyltransferase (adenine-specific)